jgi:hypothetical protein
MANIDRKLRVFLCHAKEDKPTVRELYRQLTAEGWMDVWLDKSRELQFKTGVYNAKNI